MSQNFLTKVFDYLYTKAVAWSEYDPSRRAVIEGGIQLPAKAGIVYLATKIPDFIPSAAAQEIEGHGIYRPQFKPWTPEAELGPHPNERTPGVYTFGQIAKTDIVTGNNKLIVQDLFGTAREVVLPVSPDKIEISFSPTRDKLAVWTLTKTSQITATQRVFVVDLNNFSVDKVVESFTTYNAGYLEWSRDGQRLLTFALPPQIGRADITEVNVYDFLTRQLARPVLWHYDSAVPFPGWKMRWINRFENPRPSDALFGDAAIGSATNRFDTWGEDIKSGDVVRTTTGRFVIGQGRRHRLLTVGEDPKKPDKRLPQKIVESFPESLNKIEFGDGDILTGPDGRSWYLQNGVRYEIVENVPDFVQKRQKPMNVYEVPQWLLNSVSERKHPPRFFPDQYGAEIDSYAPIIYLFVSGLSSTSASTLSDWQKAVNMLRKNGCTEGQIAFGSHNVRLEVGPNGTEIITVLKYGREHSTGDPYLVRESISNQIRGINQNAPLAQIVLCGHSMGGDAAMHAAFLNPDAVCRVVTVNAPLTGTDDFTGRRTEIQNAVFLDSCATIPFVGEGCRVAEFYILQGADRNYRQQMEAGVDRLHEHGVEVVNYTTEHDPWVHSDYALLGNAEKVIGGRRLTQRWDLSDYWSWKTFQDVHGVMLDYDPFIDDELKFVLLG